MDSDADLLPMAEGVNVTVNVHVLPAETEPLQPDTAKSAASVPDILKLDIINGAVPVLVIVKFPVVATPAAPDRLKVLLEMLNCGTDVAVLDKLTVLGLPAASCVIDSVADLLPVVVGANATVSVHVLFAAIALLHPDTVKSAAFVPVIAKLATVNEPVPVLVTVIVPVLVLLISVDAIDRSLVLKLIAGCVAVLDRATVLGLPLASCVMDSVAVLLPAVVGENVTVSVHVPLAAIGLLQPETVKSAASVPVIAKFATVSGAVPVFVTVIVPVLVLFMLVLVTDNELVLKLIAGARAVDDNSIVVVAALYALLATDNVAALLPDVVGANVTVSVHVPPAATAPLQPDTVKSAAFVPDMAKLETVNGTDPVLVIVMLPVVLDPTVVDVTDKLLVLVLMSGTCATSSANGAAGTVNAAVYLATPFVIRTSSTYPFKELLPPGPEPSLPMTKFCALLELNNA